MRLWYKFWQVASMVVFCGFFRVRVFGRENVPLTGPVILLCNHQSFLDPILCGLGLQRELDYVARDSLFHNRWFGKYISSLNAFPIQRDRADVAAIKLIIERLKNDRAIVLFPESTRTPDGKIRPIKSGFELIARKSRATTVPVVVDGAFEAWSRHQRLPAPGKIQVIFGKAITPQESRNMGREEFVDCINRQLRSMQNHLRQQSGKKPYFYE